MAPRTKPRLKPMLITCALPECGMQVVRLYPSRPHLRSRIRFTYCCSKHASADWRRRTRETAAYWRPQTYCAFEDCQKPLPKESRQGRPRRYCNDDCREKGRRAIDRRVPGGAVARARLELDEAHARFGVLVNSTTFIRLQGQGLTSAQIAQRMPELEELAEAVRSAEQAVKDAQALLARRAEQARLRRQVNRQVDSEVADLGSDDGEFIRSRRRELRLQANHQQLLVEQQEAERLAQERVEREAQERDAMLIVNAWLAGGEYEARKVARAQVSAAGTDDSPWAAIRQVDDKLEAVRERVAQARAARTTW